MKKMVWVLAVIFLAFSGLLSLAGCQSRSKVLAEVGGKKITETDLEDLGRINPRLEAQIKSPAGRKKVLDTYVEQTMMYLESKKRGLDSNEDVRGKIDLYKKIIVAQAVLEDELDKQSKQHYDAHRDEFEKMGISHILIRTVSNSEIRTPPRNPKDKGPKKAPAPTQIRSDEEALKLANATRGRLTKGEPFEGVAQAVSDDDRTKKVGGKLGDITLRDRRLERWGWLSLTEKAFAMKAGEISEPIKTKDGYHLVKIDSDKKLVPYEEAKASIRFRVQEEVQQKLMADLKKRYSPKYFEEPKPAPVKISPETMPAPPDAPAPAVTPSAETKPAAAH